MSVGSTQPFRASATTIIAATTTPTSIVLNGSGGAALILNGSGAVAIVSLGHGVADAPNGPSVPIPAGGRMLMDAGPLIGAANVTLASGSGAVYVTLGDGSTY